jgi:hypothetical protein
MNREDIALQAWRRHAAEVVAWARFYSGIAGCEEVAKQAEALGMRALHAKTARRARFYTQRAETALQQAKDIVGPSQRKPREQVLSEADELFR